MIPSVSKYSSVAESIFSGLLAPSHPKQGIPICVGDLRDGVGTTGDGLVAALALPDTNSLALDGVLAAEGADVAGVLGDFHLLHLLTQGGTVSVGIWSIFGSSSLVASRLRIMAVRARFRGLGEEHTWYRIYR